MKTNRNINDKNDITRITVSLGLIAAYIAIVNIILIPIGSQNAIIEALKIIIAMIWGIPTFFLALFILLHALKLKYLKPNSIELLGYRIQINQRIKEALYDQGVEAYLNGAFLYISYAILILLVNNGVSIVIAITTWIFFQIILSIIFYRINKKQSLKLDNQ